MRSVVPILAACITLAGCAALTASPDDSRCARDLATVARAAQAARAELDAGITGERRRPTLSLLSDAADDARASCAYDKPDTPSSDRARQPKPG